MCGRYVLATGQALGDVLRERFGITDTAAGPPADRYNVAPSQPMPVIAEKFVDHTRETSDRRVEIMEWGFVAPWAKNPDDGPRPINARAETLLEKRLFRGAVAHHRVVVPATGFFEWQKTGSGKQPWYFTHPEGRLLGFAGIFGEWHGADGSIRYGYAIITRDADDVVGPVHGRMPYILSADAEPAWLDPGVDDPAHAVSAMEAAPADELTAWPIGTAVGNPRNDTPSIIEPIALT